MKKHISAKLLLGIGIAALAAVILWLLVYQLPAKKGDLYFEAGDYIQAAEVYKNSPFLDDRYQEAMFRQGDLYLKKMDYRNALDCYSKAGQRAWDNWVDAATRYAARLFLQGEQSLALKTLESIPAVENRQQIIDGVMQEAAQSFAQKYHEYDKALEIAGMISDQEGITALYDTIYSENAQTKLELLVNEGAQETQEDLLAEAIALLERCSEDAGYVGSAEGLRLLSNGQLEQAMVFLRSEKSPWLRKLLPELVLLAIPQGSAAEQVLPWCYSAAALREEFDLRSTGSLERQLSNALGEDGFAFDTGKGFVEFPNALEEIKNNWQGNGEHSGKILILREDAYKRKSYYVDMELTGLLPLEYIPESPEQVEYVVVVSFDAESEGYYGNGFVYRISALRESGEVCTYRLPGMIEIDRSYKEYGSAPPETVSYDWLNPPSYCSGGAPDLSWLLYGVLTTLIGIY